MFKVERFDKDIISSATYYETLNYVADYIQNFLNVVLSENIQVPVPIDMILKKLEISVIENLLHDEKDLGSIHFAVGSQPTFVFVAPDLPIFMANWVKLKCIAKYILYSNDSIDGKKTIMPFSETILRFPNIGESLADMIAYEIMLPWKQSISYLMQNNVFEALQQRRLWLKYNKSAIGYCMKLDYDRTMNTFAYYHLMQTLEAKSYLKLIDINQYDEFLNVLQEFIESPFSGETDY